MSNRGYETRGNGSGRGRFRYRPYMRRRGRGRGGSRGGEDQFLMPPPTPQGGHYSGWDGDVRVRGTLDTGYSTREEENCEIFTDSNRPTLAPQKRLDDLVLSQLVNTYPGYHHYFSTALSSIHNLLEKIDITIEYLKRKNLVSSVKHALELEENEYFDITYDKITEDEEFMRQWSLFETDLLDHPEDVLNIWGISAHTRVHNILTEQETIEELEAADSEDTLLTITTKSKVKVPLIQARLMKTGPIIPIRSLKSVMLGKFVTIRGAVVRTGTVKPFCTHMTFKCSDCLKKFVFAQPEGRFVIPSKCNTTDCKGKKFEALDGEKTTQFSVYRKIRIQDMQHSDSERGTVPRSMDCNLNNNLYNVCNAGDAVTLCGILKFHRESGGFGVVDQQLHQFYVDVVAIRNHKDSDRTMGGNLFSFSNKDYYAVTEIHDCENLFRLLVASICPTIFGHDLVKAGLLLCLFGGSPTAAKESISRRSDINVLIVGDPGLGKSQMLTVVSEVAPRGVYVCGTATTVAGLTVTLVKDGDDYSLEAGALVMGDRGVCCIDEFDKMQSQHHALLEAMEQQSISIAKSGVFRTLPARTSVIAAANPVGGHYDARKSVAENLRINPALLSRFDLTFILVDRSDEENDRSVVNHILGMRLPENQKSSQVPGSLRSTGAMFNEPTKLCLKEKLKFEPTDEVDLIPHHLIRKYIAYARQYVMPVLSPEAAAVIKNHYLKLRIKHRTVDSTPVTTRQLESLLRLTQARAKLELRDVATEEDAMDVLEIFEFGMTGIFEDDLIVGSTLTQLFGTTGTTSKTQKKGMAKKLLTTLQRYALQQSKNIFTMEEMKQIARALGVGTGIETLVSALNTEGFLLNKGGKVYQLQSVDF